ncbi:hypothetical protein ACFL3V_04405 [Nanoarchaeota archaeon]
MERRSNSIRQYIYAAALGLAFSAMTYGACHLYKENRRYAPVKECIRRQERLLGPNIPKLLRGDIASRCEEMYIQNR